MNLSNFDFKHRLIKFLNISENELNEQNYKFVILFNDDDSDDTLNTFDDDIRYSMFKTLNSTADDIWYPWILLPKKADIELTLDEVVEALKKMPLWIKVNIQDNKTITLLCSKKFKNVNQVKTFNNDNELFPFSKNLNPINFDNVTKRKGIIKRLMWFFELETRYRLELENIQLSKNDIANYFNWHFKRYFFFPAEYNNDRIKEKRFPLCIIRLATNKIFEIISNFQKEDEILLFKTENVEDLTDYYIANILNYHIGDFDIQKNIQ